MIKVFFDASVLFSSMYSAVGGSRKLTELVKNHTIIGVTSENIIEELKDNLNKLKKEEDIDQWVTTSGLMVRRTISDSEVFEFRDYIHLKDLHVIGGALITSCDFLVTLDRKHLDNLAIKKKFPDIIITSPKNLLVQLAETL